VRTLALDDGRLVSAFHDFGPIFREKSLVLERFFKGFVNALLCRARFSDRRRRQARLAPPAARFRLWITCRSE
jgi:hypothetical protein